MPTANLKAITKADAEQRKLRPVTHPYRPSEYGMLSRVIIDMENSGIEFALVVEDENRTGDLALYRK